MRLPQSEMIGTGCGPMWKATSDHGRDFLIDAFEKPPHRHNRHRLWSSHFVLEAGRQKRLGLRDRCNWPHSDVGGRSSRRSFQLVCNVILRCLLKSRSTAMIDRSAASFEEPTSLTNGNGKKTRGSNGTDLLADRVSSTTKPHLHPSRSVGSIDFVRLKKLQSRVGHGSREFNGNQLTIAACNGFTCAGPDGIFTVVQSGDIVRELQFNFHRSKWRSLKRPNVRNQLDRNLEKLGQRFAHFENMSLKDHGRYPLGDARRERLDATCRRSDAKKSALQFR